MSNRYSDSDKFLRDIMSGKIEKGSIIKVLYPSGNGDHIRFHGLSEIFHDEIVGCSMSHDSLCLSNYNLTNAMILDVIAKEQQHD